MATSIAPIAAPKSASATPSAIASHANAGSTSAAAQATVVTDATRRLPIRAISQPASGIATNDPAPSPISAAPRVAGAQRQRLLHRGNARHPRREGEAVDEEQRADGDARATGGCNPHADG